jgi:4-amino-4-deoxy-L-arabinose transferase-like glycosyltransferase
MHHVSLLVEFLRWRPAVVFWTMALTQALLWTLVPTLFYSAPPAQVPLLLAIGHEFTLGSYLGPPLAFWAGEMAYRVGGVFGLYALAQICIVVAYWAVFKLGWHVVGARHAVLGVLLLIGVSVFTVASPNFGSSVLATPFWALALLHYWRAVSERLRGYWFLLAIDLGLLLLTSYIGLILIALLGAFTLATERGRSELKSLEPWLASALIVVIVFPHAAWLVSSRDLVIAGLNESIAIAGSLRPGLWLCITFGFAHIGFLLLLALASGWPRRKYERVPEIDRNPLPPMAKTYIYSFAIAPAFAAIVIALATGWLGPLDDVTPLVLISGLSVVVAAGNRIRIHRERRVSSAWTILLFAPPLLVVLGIWTLPWTVRADLAIARPAAAEASFFSETFQRRTGKPLRFIAGEPGLASLIALTAPSRPHVYFDWAPERSPWASAAALRASGGVLVWPATDVAGTPPAALKAQFPEMVPEVPQSFSRSVQGFLPLVRVGWAVLRPQPTE